ncbi:MAG: N-acetylglucosamine-6-phosphate deacetylase [Kiritimatiellaeota bacterium]|nr:N-acetylglucosamine-6-phosphate deacetylase [Kiritimatiellota bacterium]
MNLQKNALPERVLYSVDYCLTPHDQVNNAGILCEGERVLAVGGISAFTKDEDLTFIDLPGVYATPGFIDTHIHGAGGFDSSKADEGEGRGISSMCETLASHGITAFLPTIVSNDTKKLLSVISALSKPALSGGDGAEIVGLHIEGPFINPLKHGAQNKEYIRNVDIGEAKEIVAAGAGAIKIMTLAPEMKNAVPLIELLRENGIVASMGHSVADEGEFIRAVDAGANRCTHLFNGMPPLHQREVGLTAMALVDNRIDVELILDPALIHPRMIELACRSKPKHRIIGVSDAVEGAGLSDGDYHLGECEIQVHDGKVTTHDGIIAGTTQTLENGWAQLANASHMTRTAAAACLSINPARSVGLENRGELRPGYWADIAFFDSKTNKQRLTVSKGRIIYDSQAKSR